MSVDLGKIMVVPRGTYSESVTYERLDLVECEGSSYIAKKTVKGVKPSNDGVYWQLHGAAGKTAYQYAKDGGYPGTEEEFADELIGLINGAKLASSAKISEVTLTAAGWEGAENLYSQVVDIEGVTENSQVDLTPSVSQLLVFYEKDLAFVTENDNGVVTVYAIGQKPENDYTIQVTITEVANA